MSSTASGSLPPRPQPPQCMHAGSPNDSREPLQHLQRKKRKGPTSRFFFKGTRPSLGKLKNTGKHKGNEDDVDPEIQSLTATVADNVTVSLDNASGDENADADFYRWATLYENQRGTMIFSTPYYSNRSLLPNDPPPFTVPSASPSTSTSKALKKSKADQPNVTLEDFPLPDGTWRWVSKAWMIDMQGDGSVQYDGFEYNWFFRRKNWHTKVGTLGAGGWVRRRRWVRLMMRPAPDSGDEQGDAQESGVGAGDAAVPQRSSGKGSHRDEDQDRVWRGDDGDWPRCHHVMKQLERDGRKLELWKMWIGTKVAKTTDDKSKGKQKQWSEDDAPLPSELALALHVPSSTFGSSLRPNPEYVASVLRCHGTDIFRSFIYPASRISFMQLVSEAGLHSALREGLSSSDSVIEFWSQANALKKSSVEESNMKRDEETDGKG